MPVRHRRGIAVGAFALLVASTLALPPGAAARRPELTRLPHHASGLQTRPAATGTGWITVTTTADTTADDGACSLREAITASNTNTPGPDTTGRCRAGSTGDTDLIDFTVGGTVTLTADLPSIEGEVWLDASTAPSPVTIDGAGTFRPFTVGSGAILDMASLTITNGATAGSGGAILNEGAMSLQDVTVSSSSASLGGGGISAAGGTETWVMLSRITGNSTDGFGGGIRSAGSTYIMDSEVSGNAAAQGGGGLMTMGVDGAWVINAAITDNAATGGSASGGGIRNEGGVLWAVNVTLSGNTAAAGGALADSGDTELDNVTITANSADAGSGMQSSRSPILVNSIVLGNAGPGAELDATLDPTSRHNLLELPAGMTLDQVLSAAGLADNGGPTPTVALVRDPSNPAWGGGDAAFCEDLGLSFDQRFFERSVPCDIGAYEIDDLAPAVAPPSLTLPQGQKLDGSRLAGRVGLAATDNGSGLAVQELEVSVNGAAYAPIAVDAETASIGYLFANGSSYRFRTQATDADGNASGWKAGPTVRAVLLQQGEATYSSGWKKTSKAAYSGGSAKYAKAKGAWVKLTATGRVFSLVASKGPERGKVKVYVDGKYAATVDLKAPSNQYRVQAWTRTFSSSKRHTIKVVLLGTSGRPQVDVDAFAILR